MCLTVDKRFKSKEKAIKFAYKPLIAKRNITVYKCLDKDISDDYITPYKRFKIDFKENMITEKFSFDFNTKYPKSALGGFFGYNQGISIEQGIHAYGNKKAAIRRNDLFGYHIFEMIIPKGTPYFIGENEDIVALQLNWTSENPTPIVT